MQTQSFHSQRPLFQGFPLPKRKRVCSGAGNTYNWSTLSNAQKKSILDNYISLAQSGDYECLNSWIQIFINSTGQSFGQRVDAQYAGNKKFNLANADVQELIGHAKNRLELSELYIYGSGRLGQTEPNLTLAADAERSFVYNPFTGAEIDPSTSVVPPVYTTSATHKSFVIGQKRYELSNHLGNVSSVITDRKFGVPISGTDPTINYYLADIVTATDYDPYGQALPGRVWNRTGYRFGFNGQEFDSELGEVWSAEFWEYDASLGRRWDIDPIDLPWQSPYVAFDCNPIAFSDPLGLAATRDGDGDGKSPEQQKQAATTEKKSNKHKNYKTNQNVVQELAKNNSPEKLDVGYQQKSKTTVGQMEYHGRKTADAIRKTQRAYRIIKTVVRVFSASNPVSALMSEAIFMVAESYMIYYFSQPVVSLIVDEKQITSDHLLRIEAIRSDPSQATNQECRDAYNKSKKGEILEPWERKLVEEYFSRIKRGLMDKDGNDIVNGVIEQNVIEDDEDEEIGPKFKQKESGISDKEGSSDKPSWVHEFPLLGEDGNKFATRLLDQKYGKGNYKKGPESEYNKIRKWVDRSFKKKK